MRKRNPEVCDEYRRTHLECACCWIPAHTTRGRRFPEGLQLAHVCGGAGRHDRPANILMLCADCHTDQHGGHAADFGHGHLLLFKAELGELDIPALCEIALRPATYFQQFLDELTIPERYLKERQRWRPAILANR